MANVAGGGVGGGTSAVGITPPSTATDIYRPSTRRPGRGAPTNPSGVIVTQNGGTYIAPESNVFGVTYAQDNVMTAEEALELWISGTGIEALGVGTNWWPGMNLQDPSDYGYGFIPGYHDPEKGWNDAEREFDFMNADTGQRVQTYVRYDPTQAARQFHTMSRDDRVKYTNMMVDAGLLDPEFKGLSDYTIQTATAFSEAMILANYYGKSVDITLKNQAALFKQLNPGGGRRGGGGGGGPQVKLEVPDYETLVANAKDIIRKNLGRDPQNWEMTLVADEMQRQYGRWAAATKARMIGGNGTYEIPDPNVLTQEFVEDTYASEIQRLQDIGDQAQTNQILIGAATKGTNLMGGLGGQQSSV